MWPISTVPATEVSSNLVERIWRSKFSTLMPAAFAFSMPGTMASKSTAFIMIASGLVRITSSSWLSWRSARFCASSETTL